MRSLSQLHRSRWASPLDVDLVPSSMQLSGFLPSSCVLLSSTSTSLQFLSPSSPSFGLHFSKCGPRPSSIPDSSWPADPRRILSNIFPQCWPLSDFLHAWFSLPGRLASCASHICSVRRYPLSGSMRNIRMYGSWFLSSASLFQDRFSFEQVQTGIS